MQPRTRRSILELGGAALGAGFAGCLNGGGSNTRDTSTDSPAPSGTTTSAAERQDSPTDYSWETAGSWQAHVAVSNDDEIPYTVAVTVTHHGSKPCHHVESTPCHSPEKYETPFERVFDLAVGESKTTPAVALELWGDWIDDYTVQLRIENGDTSSRGRVLAYERGAKEAVGGDEYERADFYVRNGAERDITATISNGELHTTSR
ncbi:MAG: hypothetical protein V5A23_03985 [Halobacteriales archaeon]